MPFSFLHDIDVWNVNGGDWTLFADAEYEREKIKSSIIILSIEMNKIVWPVSIPFTKFVECGRFLYKRRLYFNWIIAEYGSTNMIDWVPV